MERDGNRERVCKDKIEGEIKFRDVINEPLKDTLREAIKDRFGGKMDRLKKILLGRSLEFLNDDPNKCFNILLVYLIPYIEKLESDLLAIENPYQRIARMVDERCFFLLKLATGFKAS